MGLLLWPLPWGTDSSGVILLCILLRSWFSDILLCSVSVSYGLRNNLKKCLILGFQIMWYESLEATLESSTLQSSGASVSDGIRSTQWEFTRNKYWSNIQVRYFLFSYWEGILAQVTFKYYFCLIYFTLGKAGCNSDLPLKKYELGIIEKWRDSSPFRISLGE